MTISERIHASLRARILGFELAPGTHLNEQEIAAEYGASRTPVRESLRRLEQNRLVVHSARQGYRVRPFDLSEMDQLYDLRVAIETLAIETLAQNVSDQALAHLSDICAAFPAEGDPSDALAADEAFHEGIAQESANAVALEFLHMVNERIQAIRRIDFTKPDRWVETREEHERILGALAGPSPHTATQLLVDHIRRSKTICERLAGEGLAQIYQLSNR